MHISLPKHQLNLHEYIFLGAGVCTLIAAPYLASWGFYLWSLVKIVYLTGLVILFLERPKPSISGKTN